MLRMRVGVVGASGYTGAELLRLCAGHPELDVVVATAASRAGERIADHTPSLAADYGSLAYSALDAQVLRGLDLVFLCLPHGESQRLVPDLVDAVGAVVDLAADFRLKDPALYPQWYGAAHEAPDLLARFVYGLPELCREELRGARLVAVPGCYPTAAALALAPLVQAGAIAASGIVVDAASGVSGAGRSPGDRVHFGAVAGDFSAYGVLTHRHTPEIEQAVGAQVLFTPHLAPMVRGILATCYARPGPGAGSLATADVLGILADRYAGEAFVVVDERLPSTKAAAGSNCAHLSARVDRRTGWVLAMAAIDNLVKGASGQAVQCANLVLGLPEETGLPRSGLYP